MKYGASLLDSRIMDSGKYLIRYFYDELAEDLKEELKYYKKFYIEKNFIDITNTEILRKTIHENLEKNKYKKPKYINNNSEEIAISKVLKILN